MNQSAQDAFKQLVADELRPTFKARGFRQKGLTFYRHIGENFGIVQLQKNRGSTATCVEFTINLGVFSARVQRALAQIMWVPEVAAVPTEPACHLQERIGLLMPEARDVWWTISERTAVPELGETVRSALDKYGFPFVDARDSDEGLRDHWLQQGPEGLDLAVLVRDLGPQGALAPLLERLRAETPPTATSLLAAIGRFSADLAVRRPYR